MSLRRLQAAANDFPWLTGARRIAAGFQDFARFELLAQQTVRVGQLPQLDDEGAVIGALERARAADVVDRLDDGLQTQLGKTYTEGTELSADNGKSSRWAEP